MPDLHYEHPRLAEIYDLSNGWSDDRAFYLSLAGDVPARVLDLGCGTGLLCNAFAERNHSVTGVGPSAAMLDVARRRKFGGVIEWVQSTAQSFQSDKTFDLIVMTGHAFQVLLDDEDVARTLAMMRKHLSPKGVIAFETRNPSIDWKRLWHGKVVHREMSDGSLTEEFRVTSCEADRVDFETLYRFGAEELVSQSTLRFLSRSQIERQLSIAGLRAVDVFGDWQGRAYDRDSSHEIVFIVRHAGGDSGS